MSVVNGNLATASSYRHQTLEFSTIYQKKKILDIKENKLVEFNYKVLHNILPCGVNLNICGVLLIPKSVIFAISMKIFHIYFTTVR